MKKRLITGSIIAIVLAGMAVVSIIVDGQFFYILDIFVLALAVLSTIEVMRLIKQKFAQPFESLILIALFSAFCAYLILNILYHYGYIPINLALTAFALIIVLAVIISFILVKISRIRSTQNAITTSFVLIYPVSIFIFMLGINTLALPHLRAAAILLLFLIAPLTDTFAFLVGCTLKGPKLAPNISPKKTVSGAIGGLFGGILAGLLVWGMIASGAFADIFSLRPITQDLDVLHFIFMGMLGSVFTQAGDLIASNIKRKCDAKDFSNLLPGHGGIMDRIDGMIMAAVVIYSYMIFLGMGL